MKLYVMSASVAIIIDIIFWFSIDFNVEIKSETRKNRKIYSQ